LALAADGQAAESARERDLARRLMGPSDGSGDVALERVKTDFEPSRAGARPGEAGAEVASGSQPSVESAMRQARDLYAQARDWDALDRLRVVLLATPYDAAAHLLAGRIHLRNGRLDEAVDALKLSLWSADSAEGHLVLAQAYLDAKDPVGARLEVRQALALNPSSADARQLLDRIERRGANPSDR
jgi:Flp pilus assembly protein TadD